MLVFVGLCQPSARGKDWPQFRGPDGQGHSAAVGVPIKWSEKDNVVWKKAIPGEGWSSPVLVDGRLYLTSAVAENGDGPNADRELHVLCVDAASGKVVWDREVFPQEGSKAPRIHKKNSHASPTPVVEKGKVYVHFGHQGTACLNTEGKVLWQNRELVYAPVHGGGGSAVIAGDRLIFTCDGQKNPFVAGLVKSNGRLAWKFKRDTGAKKKFSFATPLVIEVKGESQVIVPGSGGVSALDPRTGREIWFVDYDQGYSVIPRPVYGNGMVFVSSGYDRPVAMAIKVDGKGDVTDSHVAWQTDDRAPNTPSMLLVGEELYMTSDGGVTSCLDAKSGDVYWSERTGGGMSASPLYAEGRIYIQDEKGTCTVIKAGTEFEKLATNRIDGRTLASFAVDDGVIFLRSETHLYRIGRAAK
ncbi:MAG: outer membrane protein assembly factor BamB [Verrucomicrobiales bacterium]|jgi:outer membrane protein assembly factor BamB